MVRGPACVAQCVNALKGADNGLDGMAAPAGVGVAVALETVPVVLVVPALDVMPEVEGVM
jgi:hypothetical protein